MTDTIYDIAIIGGGPAGLGAAIYSLRYKLSTIIFNNNFGGTASSAHKICNYPGFEDISGMELMSKMNEQVMNLGAEMLFETVMDIQKEDNYFIINSDQRTIRAKKVIMAIGRQRRKLGVAREDELLGKGISYCATCDGNFFKDKVVGVVGGSDAALTAALFLADVAKEVNIIYRKDAFRAEPSWIELVNNNPKIKKIFNSEIKELNGSEKLESVTLSDGNNIELEGLFIEIGSVPNTELLNKIGIKLDDNNYIDVDKNQSTNIKGIFACGDITNKTELKQIITASAQGAIAAYHAYIDIKK